MQSKARAIKRGSFGVKHKTTKNRKGQQYFMQLIKLRDVADKVGQKCHKTIIHLNNRVK